MDRNGMRSVAGMLLYGGQGSVDQVAHKLVERSDPRVWEVLVETVRSDEELTVRIRCLEVLARSASLGGDATAGAVLAALCDIDPLQDKVYEAGGQGDTYPLL